MINGGFITANNRQLPRSDTFTWNLIVGFKNLTGFILNVIFFFLRWLLLYAMHPRFARFGKQNTPACRRKAHFCLSGTAFFSADRQVPVFYLIFLPKSALFQALSHLYHMLNGKAELLEQKPCRCAGAETFHRDDLAV